MTSVLQHWLLEQKIQFKKSLKGQKCFLLLQWLWCNAVSLMDPKDISSPLSGGQAENIWPWSGESCSGHSSSPVWMICVQWYLREVPAHAQLGQVLQSNSFLQDCSSCQCSAAAPALSTHIFTAPVIPHVPTALCSSSTGSQGLSQN